MTDKKYTDEEIVKALQQHSQDYDAELKHSPCDDCPVTRSKGCTCIDVMAKGALDIINRQKADIEGYRKQSEGEWISVEERLPDNCRAVLVALEGLTIGGAPAMVIGSYSGGFWMIVDADGTHYLTKYMRCVVTHWMPLPEPPDMKGGE